MRFNRDSVAAMVATVAFIAVVILGFWKLRGPSTQRAIRGDEKGLHNIHQLAGEINAQYTAHGKELPSELTEFQKTHYHYKDPVGSKPLEYYAKPPAGYTTCTIFDTGSPKEDADDSFAFWTHPAGRKLANRCRRFPTITTIEVLAKGHAWNAFAPMSDLVLHKGDARFCCTCRTTHRRT